MKPGLYALAALDGAPLAPEDLEALGLDAERSARYTAPGIAVAAVDDSPLRDAASVVQTPGSLVVFLGYLDEQQELAAQLGMSETAEPAALVWRAIEHLGSGAPAALLGEWSFLHWDVRAQELTVLGAEALRDSLFYSVKGPRFVLAPDLLALTRLPWVGRTLDAEGFALRLSRAGLRRINGRRTIWRGISSALPAVRDVFSLRGHSELAPAEAPPPERWYGTFEEAVDVLNAIGRRIVEQNMLRYGRSAFLLSGGLDSTLLTALGAQMRGPQAEMFCLSSVAPAGSGIDDEREFSAAAADALGVAVEWVVPPPDVSIYRPAPGAFEASGEPTSGPRHYLYEALFRAASGGGAHAVFDGGLGELSIMRKPKFGAEVSWPRHILYSLRERRAMRAAAQDWPGGAFHVLFAQRFLEALPSAWRGLWEQGPERPRPLSARDPIGVALALRKSAGVSTHAAPGLRHLVPYRDQRLLRLAAGMPAAFLRHAGETRALGRAMLRGRVPESVRTRTIGRPFSPDFELRAQQQAAAARGRIPLYRKAQVGEWLDLGALDAALERIAQGAGLNGKNEGQAQSTCLAAEFLLSLNG